MASKGKEVATGGKRKRGDAVEDDKSASGRKRKNREILQFFEDAADVDEDESDYSDFDDEEYDIELKVKKEPVKTPNLPFIPKEEVIDEEEFDKMMEERYRTGSSFVRYPEDAYEDKSVETTSGFPSTKAPTIWKVKCMVGREKHSAFCLMQKFVDLKSLGTKLQIISAFAFDHVKGFVYIEADKQCDINEACKGLCGIYSTRASQVPKNEVGYLLSVRSKSNVISEGMWARVKNGKYKGDLAQVVGVNDARKKATVKLIPRIDLQMMAKKFGGGVSMKNAATPAPRLISSSELEEFRPLVQYRRDRDTGLMFEVLDGLMLKDGYLYKKVSVDSLNFNGVIPSEEELLKFQPSENNDADNSEWLSQLYGSPKKKRVGSDKGGEKGESSLGSGMQNGFELYDLVCVGRKDFGLIVGMDKDDHYKILKHGPEAPIVTTVARREIKSGPSDMKFSAFDHHSKTVSVNDTIKVLEGPLKDRQGIVKHIYRGIIFMHDQNETENGGYFCCKSQMCEKISADVCNEKGGESGFFGFEDNPSSPQSPLSPKKPWQMGETNREFNRGDKEGMFSIGQTLRIRIGPLKGYLCRVLAIRYSEATVKLDSQHKVLTVKFEHLSEVRGRNTAMPSSEDPGSSSFKPFDILGAEGCSTGWTDGAGTSADGDRWNTGGVNTESTSWPNFSSSGVKLQPDSSGTKEEDSCWGRKETPSKNASWGAAAANENIVANNESDDCWNKAATNVGSSSGGSGGWGKTELDPGSSPHGAVEAWDKGKIVSENPSDSWGGAAAGGDVKSGSWDKSANTGEDNWNKGSEWSRQKSESKADTWGSTEAQIKGSAQGDSWGKAIEKDCSSGGNVGWRSLDSAAKKPTESWGNGVNSWAQPEAENSEAANGWTKAKVYGTSQVADWGKQDGGSKQEVSSWGKQEGGESAWNKQDGGSKQETAWGKQEGGSSWNKQDGWSAQNEQDRGSSWGKKEGSTWSKQDEGWKREASWGKQEGGSSWNKQDGWSACNDQGGGSSWGEKGGSAWNKQDGGSFSNNDQDQEHGGWDKAYDGGRGSAGRRGREGGWGGTHPSGIGRSFRENQSSGWNDEKTNDGGSAKGWGQSSGWKTGSNDTDVGKIDDSSWGKKNNWNCGSGDSGGNTSSSWGKSRDWNSGSGDGNQDSYGWGKKSSWNQDSSVASGGDQTENSVDTRGGRGWGGGFGGRGGSDRGGYGGRGERGGYRGRGRSDRGGYGGRGRSDRGGYGGRGRRDQAADNASDWKSGGNNNGGWSSGGGWSSSGGGSWNQGGAEKSQVPSWSSGGGGSGGWNNQSSSWNQSAKGGDGETGDASSGWNKGTGSTGEAGWKQANNWKTSDSSGGSGWNKSSQEAKVSGASGGWSTEGGSGNGGNSWSESAGGQSSNENSTKEAKEGTDAEEANPWSFL